MSNDILHAATQLVHAGRPQQGRRGPVNPPVVRASTMLFANTDELASAQGKHSYGRHGTDTTEALEQALCAAEGAAACLLAPSGLAAITTTLLALLAPGDHLLMVDSVYGPARIFCDGTLKRLGIETSYYDPLLGADIAGLIRPNTRVVYVESPGSLSFEVQDVPAIAAAAHATGAVVVADSTWATPLGWPSFALGVDVSIHAATKYIVGHSDVMMGVTLCTEALAPTLRRSHRELGLMVSSDDAYLALRGLRTLAARLAQHKTNTAHLVQWLQQQPEVERLLYPPNPDDAGHALWRRDFHTDYACGLLGVLFRADIRPEQVEALTNAASLFGIGFSWGGYESLILPTQPGKMRTVSERWRDRQLLRLHIGLEAPADLQASLDEGFAALRSV